MTELRFADAASESVKTVSDENPLPTLAQNISSKARDSFESFVPGIDWALSLAPGDIVQADGNTAGASYLVISKDPLREDTVTTVTSLEDYHMPLDIAMGLHRSIPCIGVEFATEVIDDAVLPAMADIVATAVQQASTTLSVTTSAPHGLTIGRRISVSGVSDSRLNYPALVVATTPTPTTFTCTAGPGGSIPSVTAGPFVGVISDRQALGRAVNALSMIFENAVATNASFYARGDAGDSLPSGTIAASHSVTVGSNASVAAVTGAYAYAWGPTTETNLSLQADKWQWMDDAVDGTGQKTSRATRRQVVPDHKKRYRLRFRATNDRSVCRPIAKVVSLSKSGSTTWTVVTDVSHGLTTSDYINIYGNRDTANFPNLTTATVVASVVDAYTFTVVSTTGTATAYGGTVYRINGGILPSTNGAISMVGQSISRTANVVTLVMSASVTGVAIGDYVNLHGCLDTAGSDLGLDGPYRIADLATTTLTLIPIGDAPTGDNVGSVNCSGTIIKRADLRISYARVFDYERLRVEALARPSGDTSNALPVVLQGGTTVVTVSSSGIGTVGVAAHDAAISGNPQRIAGRARTSDWTAVANDDVTDLKATLTGAMVIQPYQIPELTWRYAAAASGIVNTTTAVTIKTAAGAGICNYCTSLDLRWDALTNATEVAVRDGAGGTALYRTKIASGAAGSHTPAPFLNPLRSTSNTLLEVVTLTASGAGGVFFNASGYQAP